MRSKALWGAVFVFALATAGAAQMKSPAEAGFERLKTLQGDWIDVDGVFGEKGKVAVTVPRQRWRQHRHRDLPGRHAVRDGDGLSQATAPGWRSPTSARAALSRG